LLDDARDLLLPYQPIVACLRPFVAPFSGMTHGTSPLKNQAPDDGDVSAA
jgi:hypothetical protein